MNVPVVGWNSIPRSALAGLIGLACVGVAPTAAESGTVVLCPDVGESPDVFVVREGGGGLAQRLEGAGYRVELVDPWAGSRAAEGGFDAVVEEVFPFLVDAASSDGDSVVWIGHGLCGFLPAAARSVGQEPSLAGWVALGTSFEVRYPAPAVEPWLGALRSGEEPTDEVEWRAVLTGLGPSAEQVISLYRERVACPAPAAVVADQLRWYDTGEVRDRSGKADYLAGLDGDSLPSLLIAGVTDSLAPPEDVLAGFDRLGEGASYRMLSRVNRHGEEFGHVGMLLSRRARRGVDRVVLSWLRDLRGP